MRELAAHGRAVGSTPKPEKSIADNITAAGVFQRLSKPVEKGLFTQTKPMCELVEGIVTVPHVRHCVPVRLALALVLKPSTDLSQLRQQFLKCAHPAVKSRFTRLRKALFMIPSQVKAPPAQSYDANATQPH